MVLPLITGTRIGARAREEGHRLVPMALLVRVEVAGIEPASSAVLTGLLRAQCAVSLLGPVGHTHKPT
jgi:hypothetical protein